MTVHLRFIVIALILHTSPSTLFAADAKGWFEEDCTGTTFHITKIDGASAGQQLVLRLSRDNVPLALYLTGSDWWEAQGKRCSGVGECEEATHAKIWLNKGKGRIKSISGKYTVDFSGQHLEGQFVVKYRRHVNPLICE